MKIDEHYPPPKTLKEVELKTLLFLYEQPIFQCQFQELASTAYKAHVFIEHGNKPNNILIRFESHIDVEVESLKRRIYLGSLVDVKKDDFNKYENCSYYIAICEGCSPPAKFLRKFHFDYNLSETKCFHPIFHLQYCGKLSPSLKDIGYNQTHIEHMSPWLSVPRIPFTPISLALLLKYIFREFCDKKTNHQIAELSEWRDIIKENEQLILEPYYKTCNNFIDKNKGEANLLSDFYYGEE